MTRVTKQELEQACSRLSEVAGVEVTLYPGGLATQWWISPALGQPFGAIGHTKSEALATVNRLIEHQQERHTMAQGIVGTYTRKQLLEMPTIRSGQADDLKVETEDERIWISRLTRKDGVAVDNRITVEKYDPKSGTWR